MSKAMIGDGEDSDEAHSLDHSLGPVKASSRPSLSRMADGGFKGLNIDYDCGVGKTKDVGDDGRCVHCHSRMCNSPRGLCKPCYDDLDVRYLHRVDEGEGWRKHRFRHMGVGVSTATTTILLVDDDGNTVARGKVLGEPTKHRPGTPGKVKVMELRAALGLAIFHPKDAGMGHGINDN